MYHYGIPIDGDKYKIICPFHNDKNPSMLIDLKNNFYYCFGCNASGDAFSFFKNMEYRQNKNLDDIQLLRLYIQITHSTIKNKKIKKICTTHDKDDIIYITQQQIIAEDYYNGLSKIDWFEVDNPIKQYMKQRGFTSGALNYAKAKININNKYPIIFPILDSGNFRGWVCRTNDKQTEEKRKYLYNKGFRRRNTLHGYYNSKTVVVVEGYMDWLKLSYYGKLKHVVALFGWKATSQQIQKLKNAGVTTIISALDTDECGVEGTKYLSNFFNVIRFQFPEGVKDPGEMNKIQIKKSIQKTKEILKNREENKKWDY